MMLSKIKSDFWYAILTSPSTVVSAVIILVLVISCTFANWVAPHTPFDPATISIMDSQLPPAWMEGGVSHFLLGTDMQGRDLFSAMLYGGRISIMVGLGAVALSTLIGTIIGLLCGYFRGLVDAILMRVAEIQFAFPPILLALLFNGIFKKRRCLLPSSPRPPYRS